MSLPAEDRRKRALAFLDARADEMERLLARLVEQNSFTGNTAGGRRVGNMLRDAFAAADLVCEIKKSTTFADHLVFSTPAPGAPVALVGHLDTVFSPGSFEGYEREGGLARGPGVLDMKGGLVVTGFALAALRDAGVLSHLPIRWIVVADEEVGSPEGQRILQEVAKNAHAGLVFEGGRTNDAIITQRKGTGGMTSVARGRAAHAGNRHADGVNAILALARFIDRAEGLTNYPSGVTVNVGRVEGGLGKNTVPDRAVAEIDLRFLSLADGEKLVASLHDAAEAAASSVRGSIVELSGGIARAPLERSDRSLALYREYAACARASGLGGDEAPLVGGGSDANTLASFGVPAIDGLGPRGDAFHTNKEHIEVATLVPRAQALVRFLLGSATRE